ncbi:MAG TPA: methyltransferase, partial [Acidimicrobiia bacterium]|nr:methyltransferase [Acidimicrobiia bacterium]
EGWRERLEGAAEGGKRVAIWGGGSKAVAFLTTIGVGDEVAAVVDINPYKQGMFLPGTGHEVLAPEMLIEIKPDLVVVMNQIYEAEITKQLTEMALVPEVVSV